MATLTGGLAAPAAGASEFTKSAVPSSTSRKSGRTPPEASSKLSNNRSCALSSTSQLLCQDLFQKHERIRLPRGQLREIHATQPPSYGELLQHRHAVSRDVRFRARPERHLAPRPNRWDCRVFFQPQPAATAPLFQTRLPANVASPPGLVGELKVECDSQFFRSAALSPVSDRTAASASRNSSSGPDSASESGVAPLPSNSRPEIDRSPHAM